MIAPDFIDELLDRVELHEVIQGTGFRLVGRFRSPGVECPKCGKNHEHCKVNTRTNLWHCFSCGAGGNAIHWLRESQKMGFQEAVTVLAKTANMVVPEDRQTVDHEYMEQAVLHYFGNQSDYLSTRGISEEVLKRFRVGYAPGGTIRTLFPSKTFKAVKEAGLLHVAQGKLVDRFYHRVVIPIVYQGEVVDLYGRAVDSGVSLKHLYAKGDFMVWGLDDVQAPRVILVESPINALTLYSHGIESVISMGGARRVRESVSLALEAKGVREVVIAYDTGDPSGTGQRGAVEAIQSLGERFAVSVLLMPRGLDVNELWLREDAVDRWAEIWENQIPGRRFVRAYTLDGMDIEDIQWYLQSGLRGRFRNEGSGSYEGLH